LTDALNASGRREMERLERGLLVLEVVAGVAPLLGLLGTVLGMVSVFDAITAEGLGNAQVLSSGISEALVTTVTGLIIGIPALALYSYYVKRTDSLAIELHELGTSFVLRLAESSGRPRVETFDGSGVQSAGGPR
jgi:biopolymer transport protein ExbB